MAKVNISPAARADLREIGDYVSRELRNPSAALRLMQRIRKSIKPLELFPETGSPLLIGAEQRVPYRFLVCGSYMVFYHLDEDGVLIDRILYGRRDYMALLFGDCLVDEDE